jgi:hypothetical protein
VARSLPVAEQLMRRGIPFAFVTGHADRDIPLASTTLRLLPKPVHHSVLLTTAAEMISAESSCA